MHVAFGQVRRRIALLQTGWFVVVRFIARSEVTELNSESSYSLRYKRGVQVTLKSTINSRWGFVIILLTIFAKPVIISVIID